MANPRCLGLLSLFLLLPAPTRAQNGPVPATSSTCDPSGAGCDRLALQSSIQAATTIAPQAPSRDRFAQSQLSGLIKKLGKQAALPNHAADLTLVLAAPTPTGVAIGPGDRELATLRVYSGGTGKLVWVERLTGSGDPPWPSVVDLLLTQFKTTLGTQGK